jgi:hypothetical protein
LDEAHLSGDTTVYSTEEHLILQARCDATRYTHVLNALFDATDIVRQDLQAALIAKDALLHLNLGLKCANNRDFPWAIDLLTYGLYCVPDTAILHPQYTAALAMSFYGVGNHHACMETLRQLPPVSEESVVRSTQCFFKTVIEKSDAFEMDNRVAVQHLREYFNVEL